MSAGSGQPLRRVCYHSRDRRRSGERDGTTAGGQAAHPRTLPDHVHRQCGQSARASLYPAVARDFGIGTALVGQLSTVRNLSGIILTLALAPLSDAFGRKRRSSVGIVLTLVCRSRRRGRRRGSAALLFVRVIGGASWGRVMPSVYSLAAERFSGSMRTMAIGWITSSALARRHHRERALHADRAIHVLARKRLGLRRSGRRSASSGCRASCPGMQRWRGCRAGRSARSWVAG